MNLKASVLVLTQNRPQNLRACLTSLIEQKAILYQVVVIDNGNNQLTKKIVDKLRLKMDIDYFQEKIKGEAFARNTALKLAKGDIFIFIDDDCIADKNWLKNIIEFFQNNKEFDGLVGKTGNLLRKNPYANVYQCYYLRWLMENFLKIDQAQPLIKEKSFFDTKNVAFRKDLVKDFTFNPDVLFHSVNVDNLAGDKLFKKGNFFYYPQMVVYHQNWGSFKELLTKNFYQGIADEWIYQKQKVESRKKVLNYSYLMWLKICKREIENLNFFQRINFWFLLFFYPWPYKIGRLAYNFKKYK